MNNKIFIHEQTRDFVYPVSRNKLAVRIKSGRNQAHSCTLVYWNRHKSEWEGIMRSGMKCYARDNMFDYYEAVIDTEEATRYIRYYFEISDSTDVYWLNYYGVQISVPEEGFFEYLYTNEGDILKLPDWIQDTVFYQIFPERFCNGDAFNDPEKTDPWGSMPTRENFMGGDLKGITQKLGYLQDLGINAVYLNPIFQAPSNHKYDTVDYFKIDPHFGTPDDFKIFVQECHSRGIRVILDGVFNHCGYYSDQFQDVLRNGENAKYKDWFYTDGFPVDTETLNYECVGYYKWMPKLRLSNPRVRDFVLEIACYWLKEAGIDGWRLDVADEVDFTFWQEFRKAVRSVSPQCFILAETWKENRDMLRGDQMDSVMNYVFRDAVVDFFARRSISSGEFDARINRILGVYAKPVCHALFNLIGSHDTARFLTLCGNDRRKLKAAAAFQFCFTGIPVIYYGDEIGLDGENDPGCRKAMEWDRTKQDRELYEWFRGLVEVRKSRLSLRSGEFGCNYCRADSQVYAFFRETEEERVYVVINNSESASNVELPLKEPFQVGENLKEEISGRRFCIQRLGEGPHYNADIFQYGSSLSINLEPYQVCIISK